MINFIRNNCYRIKSKENHIIISLLMTMISIIFAVCLTSKIEVQGSIAVVTNSKASVFQSQYIKFTFMEKKPAKYQLVLGKYDAIIIDEGNGKYYVDTIKSEDFREMLEEVVKNPKGFVPEVKDTRGVGTNIMGYLLMFILLQSVLFMFTLAEDIELKQIERIAAAPVSFFKYLLSNFIVIFLLIFTPAFFILVVMKGLGFNIGFSLLQYIVLLGLICSFGIAFSMFINSLVKVADTANMMGSSIVILTTILSGSFYSFEKGNEILDKAIWIIPQQDFLQLVQGLESGKSVSAMLFQLSYIIIISFVLLIFSVVKIRKDYLFRRN
ncbi:MAG: ABC transporter permease [Clostridiaceae bacterium]|nr:ABC transporter permease [Clostridiaceae bacterium]